MTTPEFQHPDTRLRLEATKDYFDTMIRGASLLLVAHGAALAGCIAFFKEPHRLPFLAAWSCSSFFLALVSYLLRAATV